MPNSVEKKLTIDGVEMVKLLGPQDRLLTTLEKQYPHVNVFVRGNLISFEPRTDTEQAHAELEAVWGYVQELLNLVRSGIDLSVDDMRHSQEIHVTHPDKSVSSVMGEDILSSRGKTIRPKTVGQQEYVRAIDDHLITFGIGPAGTGKTYLAMAKAVQALQRKEVDRIILTRPAVEAGERLGFLPGTLTEKIDPYLRPLFDALNEMLDPELVPKLMEIGTIEVAPLAYMRGRTLNNSFIILDEAQNTTPEQMKMFLTRLGFDSKMVITGDITQVDVPARGSGLRLVTGILDHIDDINFSRLSSADVVRHSLVGQIVDAYSEYDEQRLASQMKESDS